MSTRSEAYLARPTRFSWAGLDWRAFSLVVLTAACIGLGYTIARPFYQHWKLLRAHHLAQQAVEQVEAGAFQQSQESALQAFALASWDPTTLRLLAARAAHVSPEESLHLRQRLLRLPNVATTDDARDTVRLAAALNRHDIAIPLLERLLRQEPTYMDNLRLASQVASARGDNEGAIVYARRASDLQSRDPEAQYLLARMLYQSPEHREEARETMLKVSEGISSRSLEALVGLANDEALSPADRQLVLQRLRRHPKAEWEHEFLSWILQLDNVPEGARREYLESKLAASPLEAHQLALMARRLNALGYADVTLRWLPQETASQNPQLFLLYLDALAREGRHLELVQRLDSTNTPLSDTQRAFYRAWVASLLGDPQAEILWMSMLATARRNPESQVPLSRQLEAIGQQELALTVYGMLAARPETARFGYYRILRYYELRRSTDHLRRVLKDMAKAFPDDLDLRQRSLYAELLTGVPDANTVQKCEQLVRSHPNRMAFRITLALAYLRDDKPLKALQAIENESVKFDLLLPGWKAVAVATYRLNNLHEKASNLMNKINLSILLPEENDLMNAYVIPSSEILESH